MPCGSAPGLSRESAVPVPTNGIERLIKAGHGEVAVCSGGSGFVDHPIGVAVQLLMFEEFVFVVDVDLAISLAHDIEIEVHHLNPAALELSWHDDVEKVGDVTTLVVHQRPPCIANHAENPRMVGVTDRPVAFLLF